MTTKFKKNDYVLYGKTGVCLVDDIRPLSFSKGKNEEMYYILKPMCNKTSTVYVPIDRDELTSKLRCIMSREQIDDLLSDTKGKEIKWIDDKNERTELFNNIVSGDDREKLLLLINCIYLKKVEKQAIGKTLSTNDENILKSAERLVNEEFSLALSCTGEQAVEYIRDKLEMDTQSEE